MGVQGGSPDLRQAGRQVLHREEEVRDQGWRDHRPAPDRGHRGHRPGQLPAGGQERDRRDPVPDSDAARGGRQDGRCRGHHRGGLCHCHRGHQCQEEKEEGGKEKKKKEVEKEVIKPEISSFLKNFIKKEGESLEFKCRLEEDYEERDIKMTWYFNDQVIEASDKYMITFDGTYATLFIASCVMEDMGEYKCHFENSA